jgi:beta-galactosidase/beta-glucuronidase
MLAIDSPVDARWDQRGRHPRPQLQRDGWRALDGTWAFAFDDERCHEDPREVVFDREIVVPFPPESPASGIGAPGFHHALWYRTVVELSEAERAERLLLHFGAVDYEAEVWVNGQRVVSHVGGHTPFSADVTHARGNASRLEIVVRAVDDPHDLAMPRGKQGWLDEPSSIWYPRTSGIWQSVWLEAVPRTYLARLDWMARLEQWQLCFHAEVVGPLRPDMHLRVRLECQGQLIADDRYALVHRELARQLVLADPGIDDYRNHLLWSPGHPTLIEAFVELWEGSTRIDSAWSYTALRSVGHRGGRFMLNGRPFYLKMALDQGYWSETHLAAPSAAALRRDVELARAFGFNGVRKHQKIEDPRWLFWCDVLGLLVWEEMPSPYRFTPLAVRRLVTEWTEVIRRDSGHPCIVAWVPLNESWGVPDLTVNPAHREYVRALYHLTKTLDPSRPVVGNDGWEHLATDIITIHDYASNPRVLQERYATPESVELVIQRQEPGGRSIRLPELAAGDQPVVLSEFGGVALKREGWGYSRAATADDLARTYEEMIAALHQCRGIAGYCYTQLVDTFQEQNGLATMDRIPKVDPARIAQATRGKRKQVAWDVDPQI